MHILFLTDNFPPEVNAPANRSFEHCREWVRAGHSVTIITCVPNFPKGVVYEGYRNKLWQEEVMDGIRVIRVWSYIAPNQGIVRRTLDYLSYMVFATFAAPFVKKPQLIVATSPQFFTAVAGYLVSVIRRIPFVFELRDLWPASIGAVGAINNDSPGIKMLARVEMFLYRKASRIVSVTNSFRNVLIRRGVDGDKIDVVTNGVDLTRFRIQPKDRELSAQLGLDGKFVAGYIGTHGMAHGLETLLESAREIQKRDGGSEFAFVLLGHGARKQALVKKAREMDLNNVVFIDSVPREEVRHYWSLLDVSIIHLRKNPVFTTVIPSKLFECMAMEIPVLHGVLGESAEIVESEGIGLTFEPENEMELVDKLIELKSNRDLYQSIKANCRSAAKKYERSKLAGNMLDIISSVGESRD